MKEKKTSTLLLTLLIALLAVGAVVTLMVSCPDPEPTKNNNTGTNNGTQGGQTGTQGGQTGTQGGQTGTQGGQTGTQGQQTGSGTPPGGKDPDDNGFVYADPLGTARNWSMAFKGMNGGTNTFVGKFTITAVTDDEGEKALAFAWGSNVVMAGPEFRASVPNCPIGDFDGVTLDICPQVTNDYGIYIRADGFEGAWELGKGMVIGGAYATITYAFEDAVAPWGGVPDNDLAGYVKSNGNKGLKLQIMPMVNTGAPGEGQLNTQYTDTIKNIGFFKGDPAAPNYSYIIWGANK